MSLADELMGVVRPSMGGAKRTVRSDDGAAPKTRKVRPPSFTRPGSLTAKIREWCMTQRYVSTGIVAEKFKIRHVLASNALQRIEAQGFIRADGYITKRDNLKNGNKALRWVPVA